MATLPTPEAVLNKLKSDGTFDQLRRSCLAAIEAEVGLGAALSRDQPSQRVCCVHVA